MFIQWLLTQTNRNDEIGDLARDIKRDKNKPSSSTTIGKVRQYLQNSHACTEALEAFDNAVKEYKGKLL